MDINEIYTLCNYISNKHKSGNAFTINNFNLLIDAINRDFFKKKVEETGYFKVRGDMSYNKALDSSKNLHKFIHNETIATGGATTYTYAYFLGATNTANDAMIEFISEEEYNDRLGDSVLVPAIDAPVAMERGDELVIKPDTVANINLSYYRYPNTPKLDYYIDTNSVIQYLSDGESHVWATGEIDSSGTSHTLGDANWSSLTEELEFNADMHMDFVNDVLSRVGVRLEKQAVVQMAETWKQEQKSM